MVLIGSVPSVSIRSPIGGFNKECITPAFGGTLTVVLDPGDVPGAVRRPPNPTKYSAPRGWGKQVLRATTDYPTPRRASS